MIEFFLHVLYINIIIIHIVMNKCIYNYDIIMKKNIHVMKLISKS